MLEEWRAAARTLRVGVVAIAGAVIGAVAISVALGGAGAQPQRAAPPLLPRDELVRRLRAGETVEQIERAQAQAPRVPRSAAMEFFCTHAYRVASFPEALASIAAEAEIPASAIATDDQFIAIMTRTDLRLRRHAGDRQEDPWIERWPGIKRRTRFFVVGEDCPGVFANPWAAPEVPEQMEWTASHQLVARFDSLVLAPQHRPARIAFAFYYDPATRQTRVAFFLSDRQPVFLLARLALIERTFQNAFERRDPQMPAFVVDTVRGAQLLQRFARRETIPLGLRMMAARELRRAGIPFEEHGDQCVVGGYTPCLLRRFVRGGTPCRCEVTDRVRSGADLVEVENIFGEVIDRYEEPTYRNVNSIRQGRVMMRLENVGPEP